MNNNTNRAQREEEEDRKQGSTQNNLDSRFNQTLRNVQGLLKGRTFPGKVLLTRRSDPLDGSTLGEHSPGYNRSLTDKFNRQNEDLDKVGEEEVQGTGKAYNNAPANNLTSSVSNSDDTSKVVQKAVMGERSTDSARVMKFSKVLSGPTDPPNMVKNPSLERGFALMPSNRDRSAVQSRLERESMLFGAFDTLRGLGWSGIPPYMRPSVWRLLLGYAPPNCDRREGVLRRKRIEYLDCVEQYYDLPDSDRPDEETNMLRQIAVDCPRTVPDVSFFQQSQVQKSLERVLYTWAIRHPASGYVQGINDLLTPFLVVFLSEHLEGSIEKWSISDLSQDQILDIEADCFWCLTKLLDGMQDHYTFAQPGIQRLVFKLKELVRRIDEPVSRHMEEQGLEFLQFAFRWFNCLLIREIPFHLVTRLWDTYLAEGDALPEFLVYIFASFLLTWSETLVKLEFQEMVMFLQHLPTDKWTHQELEMVLSRAYMWHTMFNSCPSHLAN